MKSEFDFKSQICTSREQSEKLLALGLKKDTADCSHRNNSLDGKPYTTALFVGKHSSDIPAWSLDRLRELLPKKIQYDGPLCYREYQLVITDDSVFYVSFEHNDWLLGYGQSLWESMLISIEWLINEELFNKEYLEGKL